MHDGRVGGWSPIVDVLAEPEAGVITQPGGEDVPCPRRPFGVRPPGAGAPTFSSFRKLLAEADVGGIAAAFGRGGTKDNIGPPQEPAAGGARGGEFADFIRDDAND